MSGDDVLQINPGVVRNHANGQRIEADNFFTAPPPHAPSDPDDPTTDAVGDWNRSMGNANRTLHQRSTRHADGNETAANVLEAKDQENAANISAVSPKDQASIFSGLLKDVVATITGTTQTLTGAVTSAGQALVSGTTAGLSGAIGAAGAAAKMMPDHPAGASGGGGIGAAPVGAGAGGDDDRRGQTKPAASLTPVSLKATGFFEHGVTLAAEHRDDDHQQTGMAMPGMGGMASGLTGSPTGTANKPRTYRVNHGQSEQDEDDPPTAEIPVIVLPLAQAGPQKEEDA